MQLSQLTLVDFTDERILEIQEALAPVFNDARPLPRTAAEKVAEAKKRIEQYKVMNPNVDVEVFATLADNDGARSAASDRVTVADGRAVVGEDARAQQQHQRPQQAARAAAEQLAEDAVATFFDRFTDDLRRYWTSLTSGTRKNIENDLSRAVLTEYGQYEDEELLDYHVDEALAEVEHEFETNRARRQLAEASDESNSIFPRRWLDRVSTRLQEVRMANIDIRLPVPELTEAQRKIVHDKKLTKLHEIMNMAHMTTSERDRERDKDLRVRSETANRALVYCTLLEAAINEPQLVAADLLPVVCSALVTELARETQDAARARFKMVADRVAVERLSAPPEHVTRLPEMQEMADELGLKSTEQLFVNDRTVRGGKRAGGADDKADDGKKPRITYAARGRGGAARGVVATRGARGRGGRGRGRGGAALPEVAATPARGGRGGQRGRAQVRGGRGVAAAAGGDGGGGSLGQRGPNS
jgi:hypothetical protein